MNLVSVSSYPSAFVPFVSVDTIAGTLTLVVLLELIAMMAGHCTVAFALCVLFHEDDFLVLEVKRVAVPFRFEHTESQCLALHGLTTEQRLSTASTTSLNPRTAREVDHRWRFYRSFGQQFDHCYVGLACGRNW